MTPCIQTDNRGKRNTASRRSFNMGEQFDGVIQCPPNPQQIRAVVDWMDVEQSLRWQPKGSATYCNVYASDLLMQLDVYLPRLWWTQPESVDARTAVEYAVNCREMGANSFPAWLESYGHAFGWTIVADAQSLKEACDRGHVGVISARNANRQRSGHVTVALPSSVADIAGDGVLQSQAGTYNKNLFKDDKWYRSSRFDKVVFAYAG